MFQHKIINKKISRKILVTRPWKDSIELARIIRAAGHFPVIFPAVDIVPPKIFPDWGEVQEKILESTLCIFLSANTVHFIPPEVKIFLQKQKNIFAMGEGTAAALYGLGIPCFAIGQEGLTSEKLIGTPIISSLKTGDSVLIFAGKGGRVVLQDHLRARHIDVYRVQTYERQVPAYSKLEINLIFGVGYMPDIITATSQVLLDNIYTMCPDITFLPLIVPSARIKDHARKSLKWSGKIIVAASAKNSAIWAALREFIGE